MFSFDSRFQFESTAWPVFGASEPVVFFNLSWFYQRVGGGLKHLKNHFAVNFVSVIYLIVFFRSAGPSCDVNTTWLHVTGNGTDYPDVYRAHGST